MRTRKDDNGRDGACETGPLVDTDGETLDVEHCCGDGVRVDTEGADFFIEERDGGGRLRCVRYREEGVDVSCSWKSSDEPREERAGAFRLRRGGGEGREGPAMGLRWGVRETWRPIAICSMVGRESR